MLVFRPEKGKLWVASHSEPSRGWKNLFLQPIWTLLRNETRIWVYIGILMYVFLLLVYLYSFNKFSSHGTWQRTCDTKESEWQTCAFAEDLAAGEEGHRNRIVGGHRVRWPAAVRGAAPSRRSLWSRSWRMSSQAGKRQGTPWAPGTVRARTQMHRGKWEFGNREDSSSQRAPLLGERGRY